MENQINSEKELKEGKRVVVEPDGTVTVEEDIPYEYRYLEKYRDNDRRLRVFVDKEKDRYYLDMFAAFELGFISYEYACLCYSEGQKYFEITKEQLRIIQSIFGDRIDYIPFLAHHRGGFKPEYKDPINETQGYVFEDNVKDDGYIGAYAKLVLENKLDPEDYEFDNFKKGTK